ncbi:MAG: type II secretion system F family protein [Candidatus Melainabacteria bacterium]|nr:type II secretion system F family protein [Candidatus Melainabacteria bacterium]
MSLVGVLLFTLIVVAGVFWIAHIRSGHSSELNRLEKHKRKLAEKRPLELEEDIFAQQRDDYLARLLSQAGLEARYDSMKTQWICWAVGTGVGLMALALIAGAPELGFLGLILGVPAGAAGFIMYVQQLAKRRQNKMTEQLPQVLETMCSSLKAGSPVMETFKMLAETAPEPIRSEFKRTLVSLQLGKSFRECMSEMANRIRTPDFKLLAQAIFISQDVGANLADVVATIAEAIRERFKLRDFMNSLTAQGKATAVFIGFLPYGITGATYLMSPSYMIPFFNHPIARLIFIALVIWEFIGFYILIKMTTFEV